MDFIKQEKTNGEDVEIGLALVNTVTKLFLGGHVVAINGYNLNNFLIADPQLNLNSNNDLLPITGIVNTMFTVAKGTPSEENYARDFPTVTYTMPAAGANEVWVIAWAVSESPVPEPATALLLCAGDMPGFVFRSINPNNVDRMCCLEACCYFTYP